MVSDRPAPDFAGPVTPVIATDLETIRAATGGVGHM